MRGARDGGRRVRLVAMAAAALVTAVAARARPDGGYDSPHSRDGRLHHLDGRGHSGFRDLLKWELVMRCAPTPGAGTSAGLSVSPTAR